MKIEHSGNGNANMPPVPSIPAKEGLREENRGRRMRRIRQAAKDLFLRNGYDGTTLREIGHRAKVGAGTIFRYAEDKRDLLYLIFNEEHEAVTRQALAAIRDDIPFLEQSINGFRFYYRYFASKPDFSRSILRESTFYVPRPGNYAREAARRSLDRIRRTIQIARRRGEIVHPANDDALALLIFELYQIECRRWLALEKPNVEEGLRSLRSTLSILMDGLAANKKSKPRSRTPRAAGNIQKAGGKKKRHMR